MFLPFHLDFCFTRLIHEAKEIALDARLALE
jgi:hypothetical protein